MTSKKQNSVEAALLSVLALVGVVPIVLATWLLLKPGASLTLEHYSTFVREPYLAIVYAVLFGVGCLLAARTGQVIWGFAIMPLLAIAIWPLFRDADEPLPIPAGAIVAFAGDCPIGWEASSSLAGRFLLGAGQGNLDERGNPLTVRTRGESAGQESHTLQPNEMPRHRHYIATRGDRTADTLSGDNALAHRARRSSNSQNYTLFSAGPVEPSVGITSYSGDSAPHNNMPPYFVVQYCERTTPIAVNTE